MTAKEWLVQYRGLDVAINSKFEQVIRMKSRLTKCTQVVSDMPHGCGGTDWTDIVVQLAEAEKELNGMLLELERLRRQIRQQIDAVPATQLRRLLEYRYINGWSWTRIGIVMELGRTQVWKLHGEALTWIRPPEEKNLGKVNMSEHQ